MWRAVVSQPFDRACQLEARGPLDEELGEFWVEHPFQMPGQRHNLSAYEPNRLFLNAGGERFIDASFASAAAIDADSRSVVVADFDGNNTLDLLVGSVGGGPLRLFQNQIPSAGRYIQLRLTGTDANRPAIGSRVTLEIADRQIVRDLFPANGFMGQNPPGLLIGVGDTESVNRLTVRWPSGKSQAVERVPVGKTLFLTEGDPDSIRIE